MSAEDWAWPRFTTEEADAVRDVVLSNRVNYWTGDECREFEREFADWAGTRHAIALMNGTVALERAQRELDVGPGDEVVVTPRTFIASASCIAMVGATPVFADVDRDSQNVTAATIAAVLTPRAKAVICVHLGGWPCDMPAIMALAEEHGFFVVEDCAQAHGARIGGRPVGSFGHANAWSFCQDKIMTTGGEGGMVTTDDPALWRRMWEYKDHGKSWAGVYEREHPPGFRWLHESFGSNYRMLEVQAAIGRIQLRRMDEWHASRVANANLLWEAARTIPGLRAPTLPAGVEHAAYKGYVFVEPEALADGWDRDRIMEAVNAAGVPCFSGSCSEIYRERAFEGTGWTPEARLPIARELGETSLMFLVHPTLPRATMRAACKTLATVMARATG